MCSKIEAMKILEQVYDQAQLIMPVKEAYLYGSYARGDHREDSDVDIFLTTLLSDKDTEKHRWDIARIASRLSIEHDVTVSVCARPAAAFQPDHNFYHANINREGIRLGRRGNHDG